MANRVAHAILAERGDAPEPVALLGHPVPDVEILLLDDRRWRDPGPLSGPPGRAVTVLSPRGLSLRWDESSDTTGCDPSTSPARG